jgi:hypothetical protein
VAAPSEGQGAGGRSGPPAFCNIRWKALPCIPRWRASFELNQSRRHCQPSMVACAGRSCQFGRASAPMMPQHVQTRRGPKDGTGTSSDQASTLARRGGGRAHRSHRASARRDAAYSRASWAARGKPACAGRRGLPEVAASCPSVPTVPVRQSQREKRCSLRVIPERPDQENAPTASG